LMQKLSRMTPCLPLARIALVKAVLLVKVVVLLVKVVLLQEALLVKEREVSGPSSTRLSVGTHVKTAIISASYRAKTRAKTLVKMMQQVRLKTAIISASYRAKIRAKTVPLILVKLVKQIKLALLLQGQVNKGANSKTACHARICAKTAQLILVKLVKMMQVQANNKTASVPWQSSGGQLQHQDGHTQADLTSFSMRKDTGSIGI
jgi:hypothetical protein